MHSGIALSLDVRVWPKRGILEGTAKLDFGVFTTVKDYGLY